MTIEKLKRVVWRLKEMQLKKDKKKILLADVEKAIMLEIGTDDRTIEVNMKKLIKTGMLKRKCMQVFEITDNELNDNF